MATRSVRSTRARSGMRISTRASRIAGKRIRRSRVREALVTQCAELFKRRRLRAGVAVRIYKGGDRGRLLCQRSPDLILNTADAKA